MATIGLIKSPANEYDEYSATADATTARTIAETESPFKIDVRFLGGLTPSQMTAFKKAADRWVKVIVGDLPAFIVDGEEVDDVLILAEGVVIDRVGGVLGQAGPTDLRPISEDRTSLLPVKGIMQFDISDLRNMENEDTLNDVITHEMGHVLGIGTLWGAKRFLKDRGESDPRFTGPAASRAYGELGSLNGFSSVPVENRGGPGTRDSHWREAVFFNELMSGYIERSGNHISDVTIASLEDIGYEVNTAAAEAKFTPPNITKLKDAEIVGTRRGLLYGCIVKTPPPRVLSARQAANGVDR